jgi:transitional endoplasmic reticulum ATPase
MKNPEVFKKRGVKIPKGIMFYGPPGNGKTMLVEAIAKESGSEFIEISSADINKKWHGQSEQMMQKVFDEATGISRGGKKVIVFFDDFDALALSRDESYPVERKVMAVILRNMDGLDTNPNVMVLAATNRIEDIDQAIKRSGRFDNLIEVGLPDEKGRIEIFKVHMAMAKTISTEPESQFSTTLDFNQIARETNGFSGADLANLINRVLKFKLTGELEGKGWTPVTTNDVLDMAYKIGIERTEKVAVDFSKKK